MSKNKGINTGSDKICEEAAAFWENQRRQLHPTQYALKVEKARTPNAHNIQEISEAAHRGALITDQMECN